MQIKKLSPPTATSVTVWRTDKGEARWLVRVLAESDDEETIERTASALDAATALAVDADRKLGDLLATQPTSAGASS